MKPHLWTLIFSLQYSQSSINFFFYSVRGCYVNIFCLFAMFFSATKMYLHLLLIAVFLTKLFHIIFIVYNMRIKSLHYFNSQKRSAILEIFILNFEPCRLDYVIVVLFFFQFYLICMEPRI